VGGLFDVDVENMYKCEAIGDNGVTTMIDDELAGIV